MQFAAAENAEGVGGVGIFDAHGDVGEQFFLQARAQITGSDVLAFAAGEGRGVHGENHGESGLVDGEWIENRGIIAVGDAFADLNAFDAGDGDDIAGEDFIGFIAVEPAKGEELGDFCSFDHAA